MRIMPVRAFKISFFSTRRCWQSTGSHFINSY